jgi:hypothetical protein
MKNRLKEKEMNEALSKWKQLSVDELRQNIHTVQVQRLILRMLRRYLFLFLE